MAEKLIKSNRNISIDILKCISMLMVVILHATNVNSEYGLGAVNFASAFQPISLFSNVLRAFSLVAVNCFVLITGYFLCQSDYNYKKAIRLWTTVFVYSFGFYFLICILPISGTTFSVSGIIENLLPVIHRRYWFFSCYFILYLLSPFLNKLIDVLSQADSKKLLSILLSFFVVLSTIFADHLDAGGGSTIFWFIILYLSAAYIRKYPLPDTRYGLIYLICSLALLLILIFSQSTDNEKLLLYFNHLSANNSIFVYCGAISLFMAFLNHPISSQGKFSKLILRISSLSFGVYLFHEHPFLRPVIWQKIICLQKYQDSSMKFIAAMIISVFSVFIIGILIEWIKNIVFSKIDPLIIKILDKIYGDKKTYGK